MNNIQRDIRGLVLVADNEVAFTNAFCQIVEKQGYRSFPANKVELIYKALEQDQFDLLILDLNWGSDQPNGIDILQEVKKTDPCLPVIILTGAASIDSAIAAIRIGAFDYLEKGKDIEKSLITIKNAIDAGFWLRREEKQSRHLRDKYPIIGQSNKIIEMNRRLEKVGPLDCDVLITGDTGTGKSLAAIHIHFCSNRRDKEFVKLDLALIPQDLIESTLFGHKRGSFTGAIQDQPSPIEKAEGGTLFLDEICKAPIKLQEKLNKFIEEKEYCPVGSVKTIKSDVRIIVGTNVNLESMIREGTFRDDLYYRIKKFEVRVPSLDERKEDIPLLARYFVNVKSMELKGYPMQIESVALNTLMEKAWPGNVRQLIGEIMELIIMTDNQLITINDIQAAEPGIQGTIDRPQSLESVTKRFQRAHIRKILDSCNGNIKQALEMLDIDRSTFYRKLKE